MKKIHCHNYDIHFNDWDSLDKGLAQGQYSNILVLVDENTRVHCLPVFDQKISVPYEVIEIVSGEKNKNLATCQTIWNAMIEHQLDRKSLCINLGGGVIGDMGGFCAATFKRGIDFIQIPTSLLAMVDASVGGKLGIDFNAFKNAVGLFKDPKGVFVFPSFLDTLPKRQVLSGMAEVYKHALIKSKSYWSELKKAELTSMDWTDIVHQSVIIKKEITETDPYEQGIRKILNFGHTIGHAIESLNLKKSNAVLHGEAIVMGMIAESFVAFDKGLLEKNDLEEITKELLSKCPTPNNVDLDDDAICAICLQDKKNIKDRIRASLIDGMGSCQFDVEISKAEIVNAIDYLRTNLK